MIRSTDTRFPGFDLIWMLRDPLRDDTFRADFDDSDAELLRLTGYNLVPPPMQPVEISYGDGGPMPGDVVWSLGSMPPFVSDRITALLRANHIGGWDSFRVQLRDKCGGLHANYNRLMITANPCGPVDWRKGQVFERTEVPRGRSYRGGWFDPSTWDGSDVFRSERGGWIFVVQRVRDLFRDAAIDNVEFVQFTEFEMPEFILKFHQAE